MKSDPPDSILVIDDDNDVLYTARLVLRGMFSRVDVLDNPDLIPKYLKECRYEVILLDMNFSRGDTSGKEGLSWIEKILLINPDACLLATTAYGEMNLAIQAMKKGAADFIIKPWNKAQLVDSITNAISGSRARHSGIKNEIDTRGNGDHLVHNQEMISSSPQMKRVVEMIRKVAPTDANVLLMGENGTGKELAALAIHNLSVRKDKFIHVDLGAIPESLFEDELFGHVKGAFTDAKDERAGRFEAASGGTLFLDEIGNLKLPLQAKLLSAIQNREIIRLGSNRAIPINVRLISATNMPLNEMAESFEFRQDLFYRINTVEITLPPLRERPGDISLIAGYYLKRFCDQYRKEGIVINENAFARMMEYNWPGNIRELAHCIERAVILSQNNVLTADDFNLKNKVRQVVQAETKVSTVHDYEKIAVSSALLRYGGNLSKAAEELGIARSTLYRKISRFGMEN